MDHFLLRSLKSVLAAGVALILAGVAASARDKPDILFIAIDDMNDWTTVFDEKNPIKTPNLERLAERGAFFTRAYCAAPGCNPSRTAIMTGLRPSTSGVYQNNHHWRKALPDAVTLSKYFQQNSYRTRGAGKIFHPTGQDSAGQSFEEFVPMGNGPFPKIRKGAFACFDWGPTTETLRDERTVDLVTGWMKDVPRDKPLFLAAGIFHPHLPHFAPPEYFDRYPFDQIVQPPMPEDDLDDVPPLGIEMARREWGWKGYLFDNPPADEDPASLKSLVRGYQASSSYADAKVGELLDQLAATGRADNTIIVLWSDHGYHLGDKKSVVKFTLWEKANHVPFIIVAPGITKPGTRIDTPVSLVDIYPTLLELAGLPAKTDLDGQSLVPLLKDPDAGWHRPALMTMGKGNHAIRSRDWRYIRYSDGTEELYDCKIDDPWNHHNLLAGENMGQYASVIAEHRKWLPKAEAPKGGHSAESSKKQPTVVRTTDTANTDKTLVSWVTLADREVRAGSILTLQDGSEFDGIVFAEGDPGKWMAGSSRFKRTQKDRSKTAIEKADQNTQVQMAIVYKGDEIQIFRNGERYAQYPAENVDLLTSKNSVAVFGLRHIGGTGSIAGAIDDARIYGKALSAEELKSLAPNQPSAIKPVAWWDFEGDKIVDRAGRFAHHKLDGGAKLDAGKLVLKRDAALVAEQAREPAGKIDRVIATHDTSVNPFLKPLNGNKVGDPFPSYWDGVWHLYTLETGFRSVLHFTSTDLVTWNEHQPAMVGKGICTGTVVRDKNKFYLFYTDAGPQTIRLVESDNPWHFDFAKSKLVATADNKVYTLDKRKFRDCYVFYNDEEKLWWMLIEATSDSAVAVALFKSEDLLTWTQHAPIFKDKTRKHGSCPQLIEQDGRWYLTMLDYPTWYYIANTPYGPWELGGHYHTHGLTAASRWAEDGKRRLAWGFFTGKGYGSVLGAGREMVVSADGKIGVRPLPELIDAMRKPASNADLFGCAKELSGTWKLDANKKEISCISDDGGVMLLDLPETNPNYYFEAEIELSRPEATAAVVVRCTPGFKDTHNSHHVKLKSADTATLLQVFVCDDNMDVLIDAQVPRSSFLPDNNGQYRIALEIKGGRATIRKPLLHYFRPEEASRKQQQVKLNKE